ncbi:MAG TPA: methyl-accepting chemotaxis protein [bacterium]|nr:methyl-accepting chemotaxis protein [bacterium]
MKIEPTSIFFDTWFLFPIVGGFLGFFLPLGPLAGVPVGALLSWTLGYIHHRRLSARRSRDLRKLADHPNCPEELRSALSQGNLPEEPSLWFVRSLLERGTPIASVAPDPLAIVPSALRRPVAEEEWRSFFQELDELNRSVHNFREVTRDWASGIEKAGRINRSVLQLNELIVNDSKKVAQDTDEAARSATEGIKSVGKEIKAMTDLKATIGSSAEVIQQLSLASDQIGDFLATITTIARKTNLLALNAGIEAARAGEHGQGFAVVAAEIKTLAEASAKAAGDVKHLVDDIRSKTSSAISLISTTGKIEENVNVVYSAGDVFMNIVKSIRKAGGLLGEISQALEDQRNDNELLLQLINRIYLSGDQVRDRFVVVEDGLAQLQKVSQQLRSAVDQGKG